MWGYLLFLLAGITLGVLLRDEPRGGAVSARLLPASVLLLLFFMGVGIGKDPLIGEKIGRFGVEALTVALLTVGGSIAAVWALLRLAGGRRGPR
jgi:hypothetical protein